MDETGASVLTESAASVLEVSTAIMRAMNILVEARSGRSMAVPLALGNDAKHDRALAILWTRRR